MLTIILRTLIIYATLILTMRVMGKRQLGELEVSELVTTLLLSEVASIPITDQDIPLSYALVPILTLMSVEVLLSGLLLHIPLLKKLLSARPTILIRHGKPDPAAMRRARISAEELFSHLRQKGVSDPNQVEYAIAEPNGELSVTLCATERQPTTREMGVEAPETGIMHLIIHDGTVNERNLRIAGRDHRWLEEILSAHSLTADKVFLLLTDDSGRVRILPRRAS